MAEKWCMVDSTVLSLLLHSCQWGIKCWVNGQLVGTWLCARSSDILIHPHSRHLSLTSHGQKISNRKRLLILTATPSFPAKRPIGSIYSFHSKSRSCSTVPDPRPWLLCQIGSTSSKSSSHSSRRSSLPIPLVHARTI